jgi:putative tryptophan/tyrosine transport system substrate-binding protein
MRRREFIIGLGGAAAAWPRAARAQRPTLPVIGWINSGSADQIHLVRAFRKGLGETGYVEGQNVAIEYRWAEGHYDRLPGLAAELVRRQVALIAATGGIPSVAAAKAATTTIPIAFNSGVDPVEAGLAASLSRPGGNLTGVVTLSVEVGPKRLELLHEAVPTATIVALLVNPANPNAEALSRDIQAAGRTIGLQIHILRASTERDFDTVFATLVQLRVGGLVIGADAFFTSRSEQLAALALRHAVPTIYQFPEFAAAGGLMSYGGSLTDAFRLVGVSTGRILKGERPADLPIQQATKVELIINLKTAKSLGLTVPQLLLGRADEIIE